MLKSEVYILMNVFSDFAQEGGNMGKSLKGKELGKGISQRKDGLYQARFTNRFGKRETLYLKTYNENPARQVNTVVTKEEKKERKFLTIKETEMFLNQARDTYYYNMYELALETGLRVGELCDLQWCDVDIKNKVIHVNHTMCYFSKDGKYVFELHNTKTKSGKRTIPLTEKAIKALKRQKIQKQELIFKGKVAEEQYANLVFVTKSNKPTQQFLIQECMNLVIKHLREDYGDFDYFSSHTFRHTFATRAIENNMQPKTLSKLLGHATLQMTMDLYCHVTEDTLFAEMQKMEQVV